MSLVTTDQPRDPSSRPWRRRLRAGLQPLRTLGASGVVLAVFVVAALFPAQLAPHPVGECLLSRSLQAPSWTHPFGTDLQGCDYLTRTLYGARTSLVIGGAVTVGAMVIATVVGTLAAWSGRWIDGALTRLTDALFAIPILLTTLMVFGLTQRRTTFQVIVVLTLFAWPPMVRLVRAAVMERLAYEHVQAAHALGAGSLYVLRRHVLPYAIRPLVVFALPYSATIISLEAVLSYVGAGLQLPNVSWGLMLAGLGSQLGGVGLRVARAPHLFVPGVALILLIWALVQTGARLRSRRPAA